MKKNKGYVLLELVISMSIIFIIILQFINLSLDMYEKNIELSKENEVETNIYNLYREIGYDFINYNIESITKSGNVYTFNYYRDNVDNKNIKKLNFSNNKIIYSETNWRGNNIYTYELDSDKNINIDSSKSSLTQENGFIKLTININNKDYEFVCANIIGEDVEL